MRSNQKKAPSRAVGVIRKHLSLVADTAPDGQSPQRFEVVPGVLLAVDGLALQQEPMEPEATEGVLTVLSDGHEPYAITVRLTKAQKRTRYMVVSAGFIRNHLVLMERLGGRLPLDGVKQVTVHQLVMALNGADLSGERGDPELHHGNLNGGDNRVTNLVAVTQRNHDAIHRYLDGLEATGELDAYLASLTPEEPLGALPEEIKAEAVADARWFMLPEGYNPRGARDGAVNLSLDFRDGCMVMSGTVPIVQTLKDKEGKDQTNSWGRKIFEEVWAPQTATSTGLLVTHEEPLPTVLLPHTPFHIEGIGGRPRWSLAGMRAFRRGDAPVDDLAGRLRNAIASVVAFNQSVDLLVVVVYLALTYVYLLSRRTPILALHSAVPGAGKSTGLEAMSYVAFNAHRLGVTTTALIPRLAAQARCTLLLDEAEKLSSGRAAGDLIQILNSRTDAGTAFAAVEKVGDDFRPRMMYLNGPTVIANLNGLAPTLMSRAITIEMRPLTLDELDRQAVSVADAADWAFFRDQLPLWAAHKWEAIKASYDDDPAMRVGGNRQSDLWRLMLAVAFHFGGTDMYEPLWHLAELSATASITDDHTDAMAYALWHAAGTAPHGPIRESLTDLCTAAQEALEPDQRSFLTSRRLSAFCKGHRLTMKRSGPNGSNEVWIENPTGLQATLAQQFPHVHFVHTGL